MPRTAPQVNLDYTNECARLGDLLFKKHDLEKQIGAQLVVLDRLNLEALSVKRDVLVEKASEPLPKPE